MQSLAYDEHQAEFLTSQIVENARATVRVKIPQNTLFFSEPMKEVAARISRGSLLHDGDPVLTWMMGNVIGKVDAYERVFPIKARKSSKIDGPVALCMATKMEHGAIVKKPWDGNLDGGL